jgi:hypothetical protein
MIYSSVSLQSVLQPEERSTSREDKDRAGHH